MGSLYLDNKQYQEAIEPFQKALKIKPDLINARINLGRTYLNLSQYSKAIREYETAVSLNPDNYYAWLGLGHTYFMTNQAAEAAKCLEKAIKLNSSDSGIWLDLGKAYHKSGQYIPATKAYDEYLRYKHNWNTSAGWIYVGKTYEDIQYRDHAIQCYLNAVRIDNNNVEAFWHLAKVYYKGSRYKEALDIWQDLYARKTDDTRVMLNLVLLSAKNKDKEETLEIINRLRNLDRTYMDPYLEIINSILVEQGWQDAG